LAAFANFRKTGIIADATGRETASLAEILKNTLGREW